MSKFLGLVIYPEIIKREKNWRPLFGQAGAAQTHPKDHSIKVGDLFLFFWLV